jgi:hypothetical protein
LDFAEGLVPPLLGLQSGSLDVLVVLFVVLLVLVVGPGVPLPVEPPDAGVVAPVPAPVDPPVDDVVCNDPPLNALLVELINV